MLAAALGLPAPGVGAPPATSGPLELELRSGAPPRLTGQPQTLEAEVTVGGDGVDGVVVDFELTEGPGDDEIGSSGNTPGSPDMSCTTAGGGNNRAATCTVSYTELGNAGGSDAVLAWIDADELDATVEADVDEGENQHTTGTGGCAPGTKGPGAVAEPDQTDCVERRWTGRIASAIDVEAESGSAVAGTGGSVEATVYDQFGEPLAGPGSATTVSLELLAGSAHDPGDGTDFGSPDLGSCDTGTTGRCSFSLGSSKAGLDWLCGYVPSEPASCSERLDAAERQNGADVVQRLWAAPQPPPAPPADTPPPPPAAVAPTTAPEQPQPGPQPRDEEPAPGGGGGQRGGDPEPAPGGGGGERGGDPAPAHRPTQAHVQTIGDAPPAVPAPAAEPSAADSAAVATERGSGDATPAAAARPRGSAPRRTSAHPRGAGARRRAATHAHRPVLAQRAARDHRAAAPDREGRIGERLEELSKAAVKTAERYSFPLSLAVFVLLFIAGQGRIDGRDPKLRLAPLDSKHDLASFV